MVHAKKKIKLPHIVIVRAPGLLPMLYTLREIGQELGIPDSTLRDWLQSGAPYQRDNRDHLWINGEHFSAWVKDQRKPRLDRKLNENEGYCLYCNAVRLLVSPEIRPIRGKLIHIKGKCSECGHTVIRGGCYDRTSKLS